MDEREAFKAIQGDAKELLKPLQAITSIKPTDRRFLEKLAAAVQRLPPAETFFEALEELREKASAFAAEAREARVQAFGRIEAEYIRGAKEAGRTIREVTDGWRIDHLELAVRQDQAEARFLYNHEPITGWTKIASADDFERLESGATSALQRSEIPEEDLVDSIWDAYQTGAWRSRNGGRGPELLLPDLFVEFRLERARRELATGKPERKLSQAEFPRWAFLYNLDRYRALGSRIPDAKRLGFRTGNQALTTRIGMPLNGLETMQDYKKYCSVAPVQG
jgi:hypothetical protein